MSSPTGGLGRGLAAILTGPSLTPSDASLRARLTDSAMSSLCNVTGLSLCGYIHVGGAGETDVTLRAPELRRLHPTQAYELFTTLDQILRGDATGRASFNLAEMTGTAVLLDLRGGRSLFFFGDDHLDEELVDQLAAFCEVYAPVLHDHDRPPGDHERLHLVLDHDGGTVHAEIRGVGGIGFGSGSRTQDAAAQAAVNACCDRAKLVDVGQVRSVGTAASFVVVAGEGGRLGMGAAPVSSGPDAAAALAAYRAASVLCADT